MSAIRLHTSCVVMISAIVFTIHGRAAGTWSESPALNLRAVFTGAAMTGSSLEITLFRWPTDAERAPLLAALSPTAPQPAAAATAPTGRAAGRGGRGGRGAAPPPSPIARLEAAIKSAPTCGYIWGDGVTGYSIKYAWRAPSAEGGDRIVLVTDRRIGAHSSTSTLAPGAPASAAPGSAAEREFTVIEMRLDGTGSGEAKASLNADVVIDASAKTLALDGYASATALLKVTR
jgi:hypothetical protein